MTKKRKIQDIGKTDTGLRKYILEQFAQEEETTFLQSFRQSIDTLQFQMQSFVQDAEYCTS